eukprot:9796593-Alexandrium_andersonii.AAC.1
MCKHTRLASTRSEAAAPNTPEGEATPNDRTNTFHFPASDASHFRVSPPRFGDLQICYGSCHGVSET